MFQDESRFGRISHTRSCWCPKPFRPLTHAMVTQEYTYAYAAVSPGDGVLDTLILPSMNGDCMQIFVDENWGPPRRGKCFHGGRRSRLASQSGAPAPPQSTATLSAAVCARAQSCGTTCVKSPSTTVSLTAASPWKHISNRPRRLREVPHSHTRNYGIALDY